MPAIKTSKERIIKDAIHLFKVRGYYGTSMSDVARACGLLKGSLYHHFSSKEALALDCMRQIHEHFTQQVFSVAYQSGLSDAEKLSRFADEIEQYFLHSEGGCLLGNLILQASGEQSEFAEQIKAYFDEWEAALVYILQSVLGVQAAKETACEMVAATQGSIMMMRLYGCTGTFLNMNDKLRHFLDLRRNE